MMRQASKRIPGDREGEISLIEKVEIIELEDKSTLKV
jgi:hypothetical protein